MRSIPFISLLVACLASPAQADVIIGFRGKGGAFDQQAFSYHAAKRGLRPIVLDAGARARAVEMIRTSSGPYELYGYSLGAASVAAVLRAVSREKIRKPRTVTTVGAFRTTDVDFTRYGVPFANYFDASGRGQRSPGKHIPGVSHARIQRYVVDHFH